MEGIEGKVAIITGGAGGPESIGAEIVRTFHSAGARVVIADLNAESAASLAEELRHNVMAVPTDITDDKQLQRLVDATVEAFGSIDFIVNSAATYVKDRWTHRATTATRERSSGTRP